ncbi:hypothetical protein [Pseudomonas aeruginosa]|uniref:hypothetical protein n=1 Tax=Pseudomonas aeruginosa TaxID=287 RepID=UPI0015742428|nr:hypothetical protein [Pseudomonas aeruginosa]NTT99385.1 hypothetical protein [Pseudomonas aeruginosa]
MSEKINMEFARRDDCLERMVPSDLRLLISERDKAEAEAQALREEVAALKHSQQVLIGSRNAHRDERDAARKEVAELRARVVVLPEPVTMDGTTTIREYVANAVPKDTPMDKWTQGYEECKRRIHAMFEQPCNKRLNGKTVSEGLLLRVLYAISELGDRHLTAIEMQSARELRALLNQDKENGNG